MKIDQKARAMIVAEVEGVASGHEDIALAYVYGSFVRENMFRDLDVAVVLAKAKSRYEEEKLCSALAREIEERIKPRIEVDVRAINSAPPHFQFEVLKTGKLVFTRSENERILFEEEVLSNYQDYADTLKWFEQKLIGGM
jgi:hypothetical protein